MFTVFMMSTDPAPPELPGWWSSDKVYHFGGYFLMGLLWARALGAVKLSGIDSGVWYCTIFIAGVIFLFGVFIEYCQSTVPGRSAEALDAVANGFGGFAGAFFYNKARYRAQNCMERRS